MFTMWTSFWKSNTVVNFLGGLMACALPPCFGWCLHLGGSCSGFLDQVDLGAGY